MKVSRNLERNAILPKGLAPLPQTQKLWDFLDEVTRLEGLHLVIGDSAAGKTTVARAYAWTHRDRVRYVEAVASAYDNYPVRTFWEKVAQMVDPHNAYTYSRFGYHCDSSTLMIERIAHALKDGGSLIVDEASHLPKPLLQMLRWISDAHYHDSFLGLTTERERGASEEEVWQRPIRRGCSLILMGVPRLRKKVAALDELEGRVVSEVTLPALTMSDVEIALLARFNDRTLIKWILQHARKARGAFLLADQLERFACENDIDPRALTFNDLTDAPMAAMSVI